MVVNYQNQTYNDIPFDDLERYAKTIYADEAFEFYKAIKLLERITKPEAQQQLMADIKQKFGNEPNLQGPAKDKLIAEKDPTQFIALAKQAFEELANEIHQQYIENKLSQQQVQRGNRQEQQVQEQAPNRRKHKFNKVKERAHEKKEHIKERVHEKKTHLKEHAQRFRDKISSRRRGSPTQENIAEDNPSAGQYVQFSEATNPTDDKYVRFTEATTQGQRLRASSKILNHFQNQPIAPYTHSEAPNIKEKILANQHNLKDVFDKLARPVHSQINILYTQIMGALNRYNDSPDEHTFNNFKERIEKLSNQLTVLTEGEQKAPAEQFLKAIEKIKKELVESRTKPVEEPPRSPKSHP